MLETPVVLIIFNRPEHTRRVFAEIARAKPRRLFVIADGPRPGRPDDVARCAETRQVVETIDWECQIERLYAEQNMSCGRRVSSGLSWVFEQVEEAIILEDDCIPQPSFFRYCVELLERYRDDERVMMVSGTNPLIRRTKLPYSYFFALPTQVWGWATWRRAWRRYNMMLRGWPELRDAGWIENLYAQPSARSYWRERFDRAHRDYGTERMTYWGYQWFYTVWSNGGLGVFPAINLVSNIGYGADATHTVTSSPDGVYFPSAEISLPLCHPDHLFWDREADQLRTAQLTARPPLYQRAFFGVYQYVPKPVRRRISLARGWLLARVRPRAPTV